MSRPQSSTCVCISAKAANMNSNLDHLAAGADSKVPKYAWAGYHCCRGFTCPAWTQGGKQNVAEPPRAVSIPRSPKLPGQERGSLQALSITRHWPVNSGQWVDLVCRSHWLTIARALCSSSIIPSSSSSAMSDTTHLACRMPFLSWVPQMLSAMSQSGRSSLFPGGHRRLVCPHADDAG